MERAGKKGRVRCRYGADCYNHRPDHRRHYAHPGDGDWDDEKEKGKKKAGEEVKEDETVIEVHAVTQAFSFR